jgi:hypothetical protein
MLVEGKDVVPIPMQYIGDFKRDPISSLIQYGSTPQRAHAPWFTDPVALEECLMLPDQVIGPESERITELLRWGVDYRALVASSDPMTMINGVSPAFKSHDSGYWHFHADLALNKKRHGDAAGIAMGRITDQWIETGEDPATGKRYERMVNAYEVPLVAQVVAPAGGQIFLSAITRLVIQLKQLRGFRITSFSTDTFGSAGVGSELTNAGLVTTGMDIDELTGEVHGLPKPFSVDGRNVHPYRELLECTNERRWLGPNYGMLRRELRRLESPDMPGFAPDHPWDGSKDTADPVAGVVGYLSMFGHAELFRDHEINIDRGDLMRAYDIPQTPDFTLAGGRRGSDDDLDFTIDTELAGFEV